MDMEQRILKQVQCPRCRQELYWYDKVLLDENAQVVACELCAQDYWEKWADRHYVAVAQIMDRGRASNA